MMRGTMVTIKPDGTLISKQLDATPTLEQLQAVVGGDIEQVPHFHSYGGERCVALCNEHGRMQGLPFNYPAHTQWEVAVGRTINVGSDGLLGTVVVIYGDDELMESL